MQITSFSNYTHRLGLYLMFAMLALGLGFSAPLAAAAPRCEAAAYVKKAGDAYDRAASTRSPSVFATAAGRYTDLKALSLFALGRYRKELPREREAEYYALTRKFIGEFMVEYGRGFRASDLEIVDCKNSGGTIVVVGRLSTGGRVTFRVVKAGGGYQIRDLNLRGIWLAQQMRSTFVGTMRRENGGIDALFKYLKS
jgi:phospholipid transport system substrate-binding protein